MCKIKFSLRQEEIIKLVKENHPITSQKLAGKLNVTRAALRSDLAILTMTGMLQAKPKVGYIYSQKPSSSVLYDYIRKIKVKDIMTKPIVIGEETRVYDALMYLFLKDVGTLFIQNKGALVGAVSRKDFLKISIGTADMNKVPVGVIMTRMPNIICVKAEDIVYMAAKKIIEHEVDSLPVVEKFSEDNKDLYKIVGKVSKTNITKLFVKLGNGIE